jgi:glycosyltransferase involved in cell wall biosynthesis
MKHRPRVSIGLPVRNGGSTLPAALDSLRAQTFRDFELIISDNASNDATEAICRDYARRDDRIRYFRTKRDLGAAANFNRVCDFARGDYFKWATHRDLYAPAYLQRCVAALDDDLSAVLVQAKTTVIDQAGRIVPVFESRLTPFDHDDNTRSRAELCDPGDRHMDAAGAPARFHELLNRTQWCDELYGLIRRDVMERTQLHRPFDGEGKVLLAQLSLIGRFITVHEELFLRRLRDEEPAASQSPHQRALSRVRCLSGFTRCVLREPMPLHERIECLAAVVRFALPLERFRMLVSPASNPPHQSLPA